MKISLINKIYTLPIVKTVSNIKSGITKYDVIGQKGKSIASFTLAADGYVSDLHLKKALRRKTEGVAALLSIKNFLFKECEKRNIDYITFLAKIKNKNNLKKLYEHLGGKCIDNDGKYYTFIGITNPAKEKQIMKDINTLSSISSFSIVDFIKDFFGK